MTERADKPNLALIELFAAHAEGTATPRQIAELERLLASAPSLRDQYLACTLIRAGLIEHACADRVRSHSSAPKPRGAAHFWGRTPGVFRLTPFAYALAAALILSAAVVAVYVLIVSGFPSPDPVDSTPIATLIESTGTVLYEDDIANPGGEYASGTYLIETGSAQFLLTNRVTVDLHGDTSLHMHNPMSATLTRGSASFRCPSGAEGFTVNLPHGGKVVDLGTEFTVRINDRGISHVWVAEGLVEVYGVGGVPQPVSAGKTVRIDIDGRVAAIETVSIDPVLADHLRLYLPLDRDADDRSPFANAITSIGDPTFTDGRVGGAMLFDGIDDALITDAAGVAGAGDRTVAFWVRLDGVDGDQPRMAVIGWGVMEPFAAWQVSLPGAGRAGVQLGIFGGEATGVADLADGRWRHVAIVLRERVARIYVDGEPITENRLLKINTRTDGVEVSPIVIGRHIDSVTSVPLRGAIDELYIFDAALTDEQIEQLARGTSSGTRSGENESQNAQ